VPPSRNCCVRALDVLLDELDERLPNPLPTPSLMQCLRFVVLFGCMSTLFLLIWTSGEFGSRSVNVNNVLYRYEEAANSQRHSRERVFRRFLENYAEESRRRLMLDMESGFARTDIGYTICMAPNGLGNVVRSLALCFLGAIMDNRTALASRIGAHFMSVNQTVRAIEFPFLHGANSPLGYEIWKDDYGTDNGDHPQLHSPGIDTSGLAWRPLSAFNESKWGAGAPVPPGCPHKAKGPAKVKFLRGGGIAQHTPVRSVRLRARSIERWLPDTWWSVLMKFFLPASDTFRAKADEFKRKNFGVYNIALQRRRQFGDSGGRDGNVFAPLSDDYTFFEAIEQLSITAPVPYCDVTWYGSSPTPTPPRRAVVFVACGRLCVLWNQADRCFAPRFVASVDPGFTGWLRAYRHKVHPECNPPAGFWGSFAENDPFAPFREVDDYTSSVLARDVPREAFPFPGTGGARVTTLGVKNSAWATGAARGWRALDFHRAAALTWLLLGDVDDMIVSAGSSFGETAAAYGGFAPVVCNCMQICARKLMPEPADHSRVWIGRDTCTARLVESDPLHFPHMYPQVDNFAAASKAVWNAYDVLFKDEAVNQSDQLLKRVKSVLTIGQPPLATGHADPNAAG
jgi:hypothetical protein